MRIAAVSLRPVPSTAPRAAAAPQPAAVRPLDGPPPEYGLGQLLKDLGARIVAGFKRLFGLD